MNQSLYEAIEGLEADPRMKPFVIARVDELHELIHALTEENEELKTQVESYKSYGYEILTGEITCKK